MFIKMIFSLLRINEFIGYCNEIKTYLASIEMEGLQLGTTVEKLNLKQEKALAASNRTRSSQYTNWLHKKDHRRDESFVAFRKLMEASTHRKDDTLATAADKICRTIRAHGWSLHAKGVKVQSAKMASLLKELELDENKALIATLSADTWYKDMVDDNAAYNQLNEDRAKAQLSKLDYDTEEVYKDLRLACEELFDSIEVLNRISPNEKYVEIANFINGSTQKYMTAARARQTKNENANPALEEKEV
ncbi:DUF6261 family protein [Ancylomarina sp. YFZ004]